MKKRFLILGAGAIGSYLGGSLALSGHEVTFLERENDINSLEKQGILIENAGKKFATTSPRFTSSMDKALEWGYDLVISAIKTYHLVEILPELIRLRDQLPPLLCLQNGVESDEIMIDALGSPLVIPGTVTTAVDCPSKGVIIVSKMRGLGIAGSHPLARDLVPIFQEAGIKCHYYSDPSNMKWSKLITNLLGNAASAILNLPPAEIYADPDLYRIEVEQVREALMVMRIQGIKPVHLPGVPVSVLAAAIRFLPPSLSQPLLSRIIGRGRGDKMPSFHLDLYSGKGKSEVNQLNGAVVRAGIMNQIPTPVNSFFTNTLNALVQGEMSLDTFAGKPVKFLSELKTPKTE